MAPTLISVGLFVMLAAGTVACLCILGLLFCDIRYSRFSGEAAEHIRECQHKLEEMYR